VPDVKCPHCGTKSLSDYESNPSKFRNHISSCRGLAVRHGDKGSSEWFQYGAKVVQRLMHHKRAKTLQEIGKTIKGTYSGHATLIQTSLVTWYRGEALNADDYPVVAEAFWEFTATELRRHMQEYLNSTEGTTADSLGVLLGVSGEEVQMWMDEDPPRPHIQVLEPVYMESLQAHTLKVSEWLGEPPEMTCPQCGRGESSFGNVSVMSSHMKTCQGTLIEPGEGGKEGEWSTHCVRVVAAMMHFEGLLNRKQQLKAATMLNAKGETDLFKWMDSAKLPSSRSNFIGQRLWRWAGHAIVNRLRRIRDTQGVTTQEVADQVGIDPELIAEWLGEEWKASISPARTKAKKKGEKKDSSKETSQKDGAAVGMKRKAVPGVSVINAKRLASQSGAKEDHGLESLKPVCWKVVTWFRDPPDFMCEYCEKTLAECDGDITRLRQHELYCKPVRTLHGMPQVPGGNEWQQHGVELVRHLMVRQGIEHCAPMLVLLGDMNIRLPMIREYMAGQGLPQLYADRLVPHLWSWASAELVRHIRDRTAAKRVSIEALASAVNVGTLEVGSWLNEGHEVPHTLQRHVKKLMDWLGEPEGWRCPHCAKSLQDFEIGKVKDSIGLVELRQHSLDCEVAQAEKQREKQGEKRQREEEESTSSKKRRGRLHGARVQAGNASKPLEMPTCWVHLGSVATFRDHKVHGQEGTVKLFC